MTNFHAAYPMSASPAPTAWRPSARLSLRPGADYFVHVDAYPAGDKSVSSDHVPFRVAE